MSGKTSIVFLNRFYWPDISATGQMLTDLAEDLAAEGWDVTVLTGRRGYASDGRLLPAQEVRRGVRIVRVNTHTLGSNRLRGKLASHLTYMWGALIQLFRLPKPEVVVAMTDPPLLLLPVLLAGRLRRFRTVYWPQDVYPELAARLRVVNGDGLLYRACEWLMHRLYRRCDAVITLGPQMQQQMIRAGAVAQRTSVVHNWVDTTSVRPVPPEQNTFLRENGLEGKFVVLYSGNAGLAHSFEAITEAMRRLRDDPDVVFLWIGGGRKVPEIRAEVEASGLKNVRFLDYLPREQLRYSLSAASVSLVSESLAVVGLLVPSKTYGILASGRPLLFVGSPESDVAAVVRDAECGLIVSPHDPDGVVSAILHLKNAPAEAAAMGERGREAAETRYDRRISTRRWGGIVSAMLGRPTPQSVHDHAPGEMASIS